MFQFLCVAPCGVNAVARRSHSPESGKTSCLPGNLQSALGFHPVRPFRAGMPVARRMSDKSPAI